MLHFRAPLCEDWASDAGQVLRTQPDELGWQIWGCCAYILMQNCCSRPQDQQSRTHLKAFIMLFDNVVHIPTPILIVSFQCPRDLAVWEMHISGLWASSKQHSSELRCSLYAGRHFPTQTYQTLRKAKASSTMCWFSFSFLSFLMFFQSSTEWSKKKEPTSKFISPVGKLWNKKHICCPTENGVPALSESVCLPCSQCLWWRHSAVLGLGSIISVNESHILQICLIVYLSSLFTSTHELQVLRIQVLMSDVLHMDWHWTHWMEHTALCHGRGLYYYKCDGKNEKNDWTVSVEFFHVFTF